MKKLMTAFTIGLFLTSVAMAHEGHDHGAATFQPPKGGVLQNTSQYHFELVKKGKQIMIYAYDRSGNSVATEKFKVSTEAELPRKKKISSTINDLKTHWEVTVDMQSAHRMTLKMNIDDGKEKDYVQFTVENK